MNPSIRYSTVWPNGQVIDSMGFTKLNRAEDSEVLSQKQHKVVEDELHKVGKTSLKEATSAEKKTITEKVDSTE